MLRRLYDWTLRLAAHPRAMLALGGVSFIESSVFPIPPDVLILPMVLAERAKAWRIAFVATLSSVLGGLLGYAIGLLLFESVAEPLLSFYGYMEKFEAFKAQYAEWGGWIVAMAGFTPFPFKVITIASGVVQLDLFVFVLASLVSRGARFYLEVALLWYFGPPIRAFVERHLPILTLLFCVLLFGGFVAARYLF